MIDSKFKKYFNFLLVMILFIGIKSSFASETFNNNLLKAEFKKSPVGGVKMVLYTGKTYNDSVTVNKKSANEYVVLLPETSNSLISKPNLKHVSDVIKSVDVKSQSYQNNIKGYTKIVIHSYKPVEIAAHVQTVAPVTYKLSENEYKELIAQASKKSTSSKAVKKQTKPASNTKKNLSSITKALASTKKAAQKPTVIIKNTKANNLTAHTLPVKKITTKKPSSIAISKASPEPKKIEKPATTSLNVKQNSKLQAKSNIQPLQIKPTTAKTKVTTPTQTVTKTVATTAINTTKPTTQIAKNQTENVLSLSNIKHKLINISVWAKNNLYYALAILFILLMFLLVIARKISSGIRKSQANFATNLKDTPVSPVNYEDKITDDMTWKEKFKACSDENIASINNDEISPLSQENNLANSNISEANEELDELFSSESISEDVPTMNESDLVINNDDIDTNLENMSETQDDSLEPNILTDSDNLDEYFTEEDDLGTDDSIDDVFFDDETPLQPTFEDNILPEENNNEIDIFDESISEEPIQPEISDDESVVKSEFIIDNEKAIYLVDYENNSALVGRINDDFFVLKQFETKINAPLKARLNEQKVNSTNYMTKVGGFRGVVEVTPDKMDLLIEL